MCAMWACCRLPGITHLSSQKAIPQVGALAQHQLALQTPTQLFERRVHRHPDVAQPAEAWRD